MRFSGEDCGETLSPEQLLEGLIGFRVSDGYVNGWKLVPLKGGRDYIINP